MTKTATWFIATFVCFCLAADALGADFNPWSPLVNDSWVKLDPNAWLDPNNRLVMHTIDPNDPVYYVGFDKVRKDGAARGLKSLKFSFSSQNIGHMLSQDQIGSFAIENTGDNRTFADILLLVAVDANSLDENFALALGSPDISEPNEPNAVLATLRAVDFGYYYHPEYHAGRPTGYYSQSSPTDEPLSYLFDSGMVTIFALRQADLGPQGSMTINYGFEKLLAPAVFSLYGYDAAVGWIYHTNRAVPDDNDPQAAVSTFAVLAQAILGDTDEDRDVDLTDFGAFSDYWLDDNCLEPNEIGYDPNHPCYKADFDDSGHVGPDDLAELIKNWLFGT